MLVAALLMAACLARADESNLLSKLEPVPLFADLGAAAGAHAIPVAGIEPAAGRETLAPGDSLTALITLHQKGGRRTEWLVCFQIAAGTNNPAKTNRPVVLYNSLGDKFEFPNSPVKFHIRTLGPYPDHESFWGKPVANDHRAGAAVNGAFLALGLERGAAVIERLAAAHATNFDFGVSSRPPRPEAKHQKPAAPLELSMADKRALAEWLPALLSYFEAVGQTPDLEGILWKVVNLPSMWSIVRHVGVEAHIGMAFDQVRPLALPASWTGTGGFRVFKMPIFVELNHQPALNAILFVTDPHPSFLACGGIVGFVAWNPADQENFMTLRVISTRWATNSAPPTGNQP